MTGRLKHLFPTPISDSDIMDALNAQYAGCQGLVTRQGNEDACGKPVVCLIWSETHEFGQYVWGACAYHANRYGRNRVIPLGDVLGAVVRIQSLP